MKIKWKIKKKKGNFRPTLSYSIILEDYERELAVPSVNILSRIPEISDPGQNYCLPNCNERDPSWRPGGYHYISVPYFKTGMTSGFIRLPFRDSGKYPEVEQSFALLRKAYEAVVNDAYGRAPINLSEELDISVATKKNIAAKVISRKLQSLYRAE